MKYKKFVENNDWEGETWNFYIPIEGNEVAIGKLYHDICVKSQEADGSFDITDDVFTEEEVDTLVKHGGSGYMNYHNKLVGILDVSEVDEENLYKGGITGYMK